MHFPFFQLGHGRYSVVKRVRLKTDHNQLFAAKIIAKKTFNKDELENEIKILKELNHPHIVKFYEAIEGSSHYYLITELMNGGELFDRISTKSFTYNEHDVRLIMKLLFEAIGHCHERGIVHRDLKPENILLVVRISKRLE